MVKNQLNCNNLIKQNLSTFEAGQFKYIIIFNLTILDILIIKVLTHFFY